MIRLLGPAALVAFLYGHVVTSRKCQDITVPVSISARNGVFGLAAPGTNIDLTNFILDVTQPGVNYSQVVLEGYTTISGTYELATTYCTPDEGPSSVVQLLTHGGGFRRDYWDYPYNEYNYSYVGEAVDQYGYTTLSWDRLGAGMSDHGDPISFSQAPVQVAALAALTNLLRTGSIPGIESKPTKVVNVGHSFGSILSYAAISMDPELADGLVLTSFSANGTYSPYFILGANFVVSNTLPALAHYPDGYFSSGDESGLQTNFFAPGDFDPKILTFALATVEPLTIGEALTLNGVIGSINNFAGPVLVVTGEHDIPFCGGNCFATGDPEIASIPAAVQKLFPDATAFETSIVPGAGHGLNLHYTHPTTYGTIQNFLLQHSLAPEGFGHW